MDHGVKKISRAHACTDIFYSLYANEKKAENALNQLRRVQSELQKNFNKRKNVETLNHSR